MIYLAPIPSKKDKQEKPEIDIPEVMTPTEVANILRVSAPTVRKLIRTGKLPAIKVSQQTRILKPDFEQFIKDNTT